MTITYLTNILKRFIEDVPDQRLSSCKCVFLGSCGNISLGCRPTIFSSNEVVFLPLTTSSDVEVDGMAGVRSYLVSGTNNKIATKVTPEWAVVNTEFCLQRTRLTCEYRGHPLMPSPSETLDYEATYQGAKRVSTSYSVPAQ
jgi:hypothetical protein